MSSLAGGPPVNDQSCIQENLGYSSEKEVGTIYLYIQNIQLSIWLELHCPQFAKLCIIKSWEAFGHTW